LGRELVTIKPVEEESSLEQDVKGRGRVASCEVELGIFSWMLG